MHSDDLIRIGDLTSGEKAQIAYPFRMSPECRRNDVAVRLCIDRQNLMDAVREFLESGNREILSDALGLAENYDLHFPVSYRKAKANAG